MTATAFTINPYRHAYSYDGRIYARVRHDADGTPNKVEQLIASHTGGASHWRKVWSKGKVASKFAQRVLDEVSRNEAWGIKI